MNNVPKLRFKEFSDDWESKKLKDISKIIGGGTPSTDNQDYWNGDIQWFTPTEIKNNKYVSRSSRTITESGLKNSSAKILPKGTILMTTRATLGEMAILKNEATTNQGFQSIIVDERNNTEFIYYLQPKLKKYCEENASGSTFLEISKRSVENFKASIPSLLEQRKIASFLSLFDKKIELQEEKVELLKEYKKGMMQKIFSQELRFKDENREDYPEWEGVKLSKISCIKTGKLDANAMSIDGEYAFFTCSKEIFKTDSCAFEGDALLIAGNGDIGGVKYYNGKFNAYQRTYVLQDFKCDVIFLKFFIEKYLPRRVYSNVNVGAMPYITLDVLANMDIFLPIEQEQQKIRKFLSIVDSKIELEQEKLNELKEYKKGLLQQMFI